MCHDPKVFLQTLPSLRLKSLPDTSISPFLQFSTPLYQTEASHLYSRTLFIITSHPWAAVSAFHIWSSLQSPSPLLSRDWLMPDKTVPSNHQNNIFSPVATCHSAFADHFGFRQRQLYQKAEAICMPRHPKEYVEDMLFLWPGQTDPLSSTHYPMCSSI